MERTKIVITEERLPIDTSRKAKAGSPAVLLYDNRNKCYYETSLDEIISSITARLEKKEEEVDSRLSAKESEIDSRCDELEKRLVQEQSNFISDMVSTNEAIIALVQKDGGKTE